MDKEVVNILLLGTSGNGKSSCGNLIVGSKVFKTSANITNERSSVAQHSREIDDYLVSVLDIPGIDPDLSSEETATTFQTDIQEALKHCKSGVTALVLVLKYGSRFTKQENETVRLMNSTLGDDVIKNCVILVMTHGDCFEEAASKDFITWCEEQDGAIKTPFKECNYRCVLFDNKTKDQSKIKKQLVNLLKFTHEIKSYIASVYVSAEEGRAKLQKAILAPRLLTESANFIGDLRSEMNTLENVHGKNNAQLIEGLRRLLNKLNQYEIDRQSSHSADLDDKSLSPSKMAEFFRLELETKIKLKVSEEEEPKQSTVNVSFNRQESLRMPVKRLRIIKVEDETCTEKETKKDIGNDIWASKHKGRCRETVNLLLIGTAGNGKSSCGNTIIGSKAFPTSSMCSEVSNSVSKFTTQLEDVNINVVEMPGIGIDNGKDRDAKLHTYDRYITNAFEKCNHRFSALILVLKYGSRYTVQEKETVEFIQILLGKDVLCRNTICLFSFGDQFEEETGMTNESKNFKDWCLSQKGEVKVLLDECDNRYVLFNNKMYDDDKRYDQVNALLSFIKENTAYTSDQYHKALKKRKLTPYTEKRLIQLMLNIIEHDVDDDGFTAEQKSDLKVKLERIEQDAQEAAVENYVIETINRLKTVIKRITIVGDFSRNQSIRTTVCSTTTNTEDTQNLLNHKQNVKMGQRNQGNKCCQIL